jgi:hypothetical protein
MQNSIQNVGLHRLPGSDSRWRECEARGLACIRPDPSLTTLSSPPGESRKSGPGTSNNTGIHESAPGRLAAWIFIRNTMVFAEEELEMYARFPIECLCIHQQERFQLTFARNAATSLPRFDDSSYDARGRALAIMADTEEALERPLGVIRDTYGDQVRISAPAIRYREGELLEEPYMTVRVQCAPDHFEAVKNDLEARAALVVEADGRSDPAVIRATAPLQVLLGYARRLAEIAGADAGHSMQLSHYAPVSHQPPPGGHAA